MCSNSHFRENIRLDIDDMAAVSISINYIGYGLCCLSVIFINYLDDGVINKLLKFVDDTKIVSTVGTAENVKVLQDDLHKTMV